MSKLQSPQMKHIPLKERIISMLRPSKFARAAVAELKGYEKAVSREDLHKNKTGELINITSSKFNSHGHKVEEEHLDVDPNISSLLGWVPYVPEHTSVVVYHFFSVNYALRKQALVRLTLVNKLSIVKSINFWLPPFLTHEFDLVEYFKGLTGNSIFIELFHPEIPKNHGGHDGHLRAWGKYYSDTGEFISTVHTAPLVKNNQYSGKSKNARVYFPKINEESQRLLISRSNLEEISDSNSNGFWASKEYHYGFSVIKDSKGNPRSVWHHAPSHGLPQSRSNKSFKTTQGFWVPPLKDIDPVLAIDSTETLLIDHQEITIYLIIGNSVVKSRVLNVDGNFSSSISEIFGGNVAGPYTIMCDFWCNNFGYLHVHYDTNNTSGDQVHAHVCSWSVNNTKIVPIPVKSQGRTRKFLHIHVSQRESNVDYLIIHTNPIEGIQELRAKIRLITDFGVEELLNVNLDSSQPINVYNLHKLFPKLSLIAERNAIVQIESVDNNFASSLLHCDLLSGAIAVDHLTGG